MGWSKKTSQEMTLQKKLLFMKTSGGRAFPSRQREKHTQEFKGSNQIGMVDRVEDQRGYGIVSKLE